MRKAKNNLATVRKSELKACMTITMAQILKDCNLPKPIFKKLTSLKIAEKSLGNISVPAAEFTSGLTIETRTRRDQYVI